MDLQNLVIELRRKVDLLQNTQTVFVNSEPKQPKTNSIWIDKGTSKFWDGANWVIGGGAGGVLTDVNTTVSFSATDYRIIAWAAGIVSVGTASSKIDYATTAGNFTMTTTTYFYWQSDLPTSIQTTTTAGAVVVAGGILLAVGRMNPDTANKASIKAFGGPTVDLIIADQIVANSITTNMLQANSITASKLAVTLLYAGAITLDTNGLIQGGQTAYNAGTGFFLGYSSGYKLSIGNSAGNKLTWNGTTLAITGTITASSGTIGGFTIGSTTLSVVNGGNTTTISSGTTTFLSGPTGAPTVTISQAGAITATSGTIGGSTLSASSITGGTIQTASSGARIILSGSSMQSVDASANTITINSSNNQIGFQNGANAAYLRFRINTGVANLETDAIFRSYSAIYSTGIGTGQIDASGTINANFKFKLPVGSNLY